MKVRNSFGTKFRGTLGKAFVASSWKGHAYLRSYVIPRDSKTERQVAQRSLFREAVAAWHAISDDERRAYDREASGMSGFNLFVSRSIREARRRQSLILDVR